MEFQKLIKQLKDLNLPDSEYVVVGSGTLGALGIREANDLDVLVTFDLWDTLAKNNEVEMSGHVENINFGEVQILGHGSQYRDDEIARLDDMISTAKIIDGIRFLNLELVKKFKQKQGREKDLKDVELIDKYLQKV